MFFLLLFCCQETRPFRCRLQGFGLFSPKTPFFKSFFIALLFFFFFFFFFLFFFCFFFFFFFFCFSFLAFQYFFFLSLLLYQYCFLPFLSQELFIPVLLPFLFSRFFYFFPNAFLKPPFFETNVAFLFFFSRLALLLVLLFWKITIFGPRHESQQHSFLFQKCEKLVFGGLPILLLSKCVSVKALFL